jgi:hypothetical protein
MSRSARTDAGGASTRWRYWPGVHRHRGDEADGLAADVLRGERYGELGAVSADDALVLLNLHEKNSFVM